MQKRRDTSWIELRDWQPRCELRLFCVHGAGGGAHHFQAWVRGAPSGVEVCPLQLPGRLSRANEPAYTRLQPLVHDLVNAITPELDRPFAFFGHSLGALVSFEVARELRRRELVHPQLLIVAARGAPNTRVELPPVHELPSPELVETMQVRYGAIPEALLAEPELLSCFLPPLRADLEAHHTYRYQHEEPLAVPIIALGGAADTLVPVHHLDAWQSHTTLAFERRLLPGDHYFHQHDPPAFLRLLAGLLAPLVPASPSMLGPTTEAAQ